MVVLYQMKLYRSEQVLGLLVSSDFFKIIKRFWNFLSACKFEIQQFSTLEYQIKVGLCFIVLSKTLF